MLSQFEKRSRFRDEIERKFKSLFMTNTLEGSQYYLVSDKLFALIGDEIDFQKS